MTDGPATTTLHTLLTGDSTVGKSLLLQSLTEVDTNCILTPWLTGMPVTFASIYNSAVAKREIGGQQYQIIYTIDPQVSQRFIHVRTHTCLVCFSLVNLESYENVRTKWYPDLREVNQDAVVFLVGTKADLREANINGTRQDLSRGGTDVITYEQGLAMQKEIGAERYFESPSSIAGESLGEFFRQAGIASVKVHNQRNIKAVDKGGKLTSCVVV